VRGRRAYNSPNVVFNDRDYRIGCFVETVRRMSQIHGTQECAAIVQLIARHSATSLSACGDVHVDH
jgi:hypothetical protein